MKARIAPSRCTSAHLRNFPERFAGAPGALLGRVLDAQSVDELKGLRVELAALEEQPGTAIACMVIRTALTNRVARVVPMPVRRSAAAAHSALSQDLTRALQQVGG